MTGRNRLQGQTRLGEATPMSPRRLTVWSISLAATLLAASGLATWTLQRGGGLQKQTNGAHGVWIVPASDLYEVSIDAGGSARLLIDRTPVAEQTPADRTVSRVLWLEAGEHEVVVEFATGGPTAVALSAGRAGHPLVSFDPERLRPAPSRYPGARRLLAVVRSVLRIAGIIALGAACSLALYLLALAGAPIAARRVWRRPPITLRAAARASLVALVLAYAALLRFDALAQTRGPVDRPSWLGVAQAARQGTSAIRPGPVGWNRTEGGYVSDPYTYLQYAREMRSFYAAHRREPLYPFATKVSLALLDDQDIAVGVTSGVFSLLAVAATFLVGATAFSYWVGLGAAAALAVEYQVVTIGVDGGRDDAFTLAVLLFVWSMLRHARAPAWRTACALGLLAGLACLVRITALSFIVPGLAWLVMAGTGPWRARFAALAPAVLIMTLVTAPFLINCWRVYGDPLYTINVHADIYRQAERQAERQVVTSETTGQFLSERLRERPAEMADTILMGFTWYPFANKWTGFDPWLAGLGSLLAVASLAGLVLCGTSSDGRILLAVLVTSLIPYAATWRLIGDWRFTEHAYPFLLIASLAAVSAAATLAWPARVARMRSALGPRQALAWLATLTVVAGLAWMATRTLPAMVVREAISSGTPVNVAAGARDFSFMGDGWSRPLAEGAVTARVAVNGRADVWLPLPRSHGYDLTVRLDPFPRPLGVVIERPTAVSVFVNDHLAAIWRLTWNPERVGAYDLPLSAALVHAGWNKLTFYAPAGDRFRFWYVRARGPLDGGAAAPENR